MTERFADLSAALRRDLREVQSFSVIVIDAAGIVHPVAVEPPASDALSQPHGDLADSPISPRGKQRMRHLAKTAVVLLLLAAGIHTASAAPFSDATCDSPKFEAFMLAHLGHGNGDTSGKPLGTRFDYGPIESAQTTSNTGNRISCEITVRLDTRSGPRSIRGIFTATAGAGHNTWHWAPGN